MKWMIDFELNPPDEKIHHTNSILLTGSCFTEHIGGQLKDLHFNLLQNPNGILFDPGSIAYSLDSYIRNQIYEDKDLILHNELWHSWFHHSRFSGIHQSEVLQTINASQQRAHQFLKNADWLIITLGSSYQYQLIESGRGVANCHRVPGNQFRKHLMTIEEINSALDNVIHRLFAFNKTVRILFTVSPVRHLKDGVIENNRSKARLIEVVHHLTNKFDRIYYFPAYELVNDVLRDYRFFEQDMAHPTPQASDFVFEHFIKQFIHESWCPLLEELQKLHSAYQHRPFQPATSAYKEFMKANRLKIERLQEQHPHIDLKKEWLFFTRNLEVG